MHNLLLNQQQIKYGKYIFDFFLAIFKDVRPDGFGSIGSDVELSGGKMLIFRQLNQ
jgi:hypothetical protein